jgi:hypothetical protein
MHGLAPRLIAVFLFGAAAGVHGPAGAQDIHPKLNRSDSSTLAAQVRRGRIARDAGQWVEAKAAFKAALDATDPAESTAASRAELAGEIGLCELALRSYRDAAEHLEASLEERKLLSPALQRRFDAGMAKALPHVVTLYLSVRPPDAELLIDGQPVGRPAGLYKLFLEPGRHFLRGVSRGHEPVFQVLDAGAGKDLSMVLTLSPSAAGAMGTAAREQQKAPGPARPPVASSAKRSSVVTDLLIPGLVLTSGTLLTGGTLLVWSAVTDADLDERASAVGSTGCLDKYPTRNCSELRDLQARRDLLSDVGWASMTAGAVFGAATLASVFVGRSKPVQVVPLATGKQAGLVFYGVW